MRRAVECVWLGCERMGRAVDFGLGRVREDGGQQMIEGRV